jgi:hypothetical protein
VDHEQAVRYRLKLDARTPSVVGDGQIRQFIHDGFVKIQGAFPREFAAESRSILWRDTGCDEADPTTWTKPVIRLGMYEQAPFTRRVVKPRPSGWGYKTR